MNHLERPLRHAALVPLLAILALGCQTVGEAEPELLPPDVFLTGVTPVGGGLFEQRVRFSFRVTNPNDVDLDVTGSTFTLDLNDQPFARGVSNESFAVPALGESTFQAEASTTTLGLLDQLRTLSSRRELTYLLSGQFYVDGHRGGLPFERAADLGGLSDFTGGGEDDL